MDKAFYIVALDKEDLSETEKYFAIMVAAHVLYALEHYGYEYGDIEFHSNAINFYVDNELYFNRADDEILDELSHKDLQRIKAVVGEVLCRIRKQFGDNELKQEFFVNESRIGVRYV